MSPAFAAPAVRNSLQAPNRMVFVYVPNGKIMEFWTPTAEGRSFDFPDIIEPLAPYRENLLVLSGLTQNGGRAWLDGGGDHARAAASFLTGGHPFKSLTEVNVGISVDQIAAKALGSETRIPSLEMGLETNKQAGNCDTGYTCAYTNNISWRSPTTPNPPELNPRLIFERMFGSGDVTETPEVRERRNEYDRSILDYVLTDTRKLKNELGASDRRKMDEYLTAVREIEQRITRAEKETGQSWDLTKLAPGFQKPMGILDDYKEHSKTFFDLMTLAMQTDSTRVMSLMFARESSNQVYREIGISDGHHNLTHHAGRQDWIDKVHQINRYHVECFSYFVDKLSKTPDGDGTLLDHSMVLYGSALSDGNEHLHDNLPLILAGGGCGTLKTGRHVVYRQETPLNNLFLSMLDRLGVKEDGFGDSTGKLDRLNDV